MRALTFCACGRKLDRDYADIETAILAMRLFEQGHKGKFCRLISQPEYNRIIDALIKRKAEAKRARRNVKFA